MLLIIGNNNMGLRELYTMMLDNHPAGWITSFMSGLPAGVESIVSGYDAVVYELGPADRAERVATAIRLHAAGVPVITHVEGRQAAQRAEELVAAGVLVVPNPVNGAHIEGAIDALVAGMRRARDAAPRIGVRGFFRRLLNGV